MITDDELPKVAAFLDAVDDRLHEAEVALERLRSLVELWPERFLTRAQQEHHKQLHSNMAEQRENDEREAEKASKIAPLN